MLVRKTILREVAAGNIYIDPFNPNHVGPNSVDVTLSNKLLTYVSDALDMRSENPTTEITIPEEGMWLYPGELYLGATNETATSKKYVPFYDGRSSVGRLGIFSHVTAGFGDVGWGCDKVTGACLNPTWTLEILVVKKIRVYPNSRIGQVVFFETSEEVGPGDWYTGKYDHQVLPQASMMFKDKAV